MQAPFRTLKNLTKAAVFSLLLMSSSSFAQTAVTDISDKLKAQAEYLKADSKTAVLIAHGFLTTNKFHTIQTMANGLFDEGYSVLAPNLTLNISQRSQSLKCNSIHTHTLQGDAKEINIWIDWLKKQGYENIVLLGHSSGSQELLESQVLHQDPAVKLTIFTSLFYFDGKGVDNLQADIDKAKKLIENNLDTPAKYSFLFCKNNYVATPESFLSYLTLTRENNLKTLNNLKPPSYTIIGSADKRFEMTGYDWLDELKATGTKVVMIEGANHFFSSEHEFDLQDKLIEIMAKHF